jgi:hypothetical protein
VREGACIGAATNTTALNIEVDPERCRFSSRKSDFALPYKTFFGRTVTQKIAMFALSNFGRLMGADS